MMMILSDRKGVRMSHVPFKCRQAEMLHCQERVVTYKDFFFFPFRWKLLIPEPNSPFKEGTRATTQLNCATLLHHNHNWFRSTHYQSYRRERVLLQKESALIQLRGETSQWGAGIIVQSA